MGQNWYVISQGNEQQGPLTEAEVMERVLNGDLSPANYCWTESFTDWIPLSEAEPFSAHFGKPSDQKPPPQPPVASEQVSHASIEGRQQPSAGSNLSSILSRGWSTVLSGIDSGKEGASKMVNVAKLRLRLQRLKREREELCQKLGEAAYTRRFELGLEGVLPDETKAVADLDSTIATLEQEIVQAETA